MNNADLTVATFQVLMFDLLLQGADTLATSPTFCKSDVRFTDMTDS